MFSLRNFLLGSIFSAFTVFTASAATFSEADVDGDNALSLTEATNAGLQDIVSKFDKLDSDKDGKLSKAELKANR